MVQGEDRPGKLLGVVILLTCAWGAFRTEFHATYDYKPIWEEQRKKGSRK